MNAYIGRRTHTTTLLLLHYRRTCGCTPRRRMRNERPARTASSRCGSCLTLCVRVSMRGCVDVGSVCCMYKQHVRMCIILLMITYAHTHTYASTQTHPECRRASRLQRLKCPHWLANMHQMQKERPQALRSTSALRTPTHSTADATPLQMREHAGVHPGV
jgi:hypothetical protein